MNNNNTHPIFIFGSNLAGFHGAGAAGFAMNGKDGNHWRTCSIIQACIKGTRQKGILAVWGQAEGHMIGTRGESYAIPTVTKPGAKRSIPLSVITQSVEKLIGFMKLTPDRTFALSPFGAGLAGYSIELMAPLWKQILDEPNARWAKTVPYITIKNYDRALS